MFTICLYSFRGMARGWTPSVVPQPWRKKVSTLSPNPPRSSVRDLPVHISNECHLQTRALKPTKLVDRSFKRCFFICFNYSLERKFSMMLSKAVASLTSLRSQYKKRISNIDSDVNSETQHEDIFSGFCCFGRSFDLDGNFTAGIGCLLFVFKGRSSLN